MSSLAASVPGTWAVVVVCYFVDDLGMRGNSEDELCLYNASGPPLQELTSIAMASILCSETMTTAQYYVDRS